MLGCLIPVRGSGTRCRASTARAGLSPGSGTGSGSFGNILPSKVGTNALAALPRPPAPRANHQLAALLPGGRFFYPRSMG